MSEGESKQLIATVERAADVLTLFTTVEGSDLGVTEIAKELELSKAVVHRVLNTLVSKGFIETDDRTRRYRLGPAVLALGEAYVERLDLRAHALWFMRKLSDTTGETATVSLRYEHEQFYVDQITPSRQVKLSVSLGRRRALHDGAPALVFLSLLDEQEREAYIAGHGRTGEIPDPDALRQELALIREQGYATDEGDGPSEPSSIAAPILDHRGEPTAVIGLCGPRERFADVRDEAITLLLDATTHLSYHLGRPRNWAISPPEF
mgnify:CR=1 FL=1